MISVRVDDKTGGLLKKCGITRKDIKETAAKTLVHEGFSNAELSILFVDDKNIQDLNRKFRDIDRPTDVLAFSMREGEDKEINPNLLGDVVISLEMARARAKEFKSTEKREIYLYLIHGILHLLGYDDAAEKERSLMQKKQEEVLKIVYKITQ